MRNLQQTGMEVQRQVWDRHPRWDNHPRNGWAAVYHSVWLSIWDNVRGRLLRIVWTPVMCAVAESLVDMQQEK